MASVFIIDDSLYMRTMLKHILSDAGHEIVAESDGTDVLEQLGKIDPDVITLDVILPDSTGLELLKEIKVMRPDVKVVMVSAVGQDVILKEAMELGAMDYIIKPFTEERVVETVERSLSIPSVNKNE